jgi:hypothetical protein
VLKDMCFKFGGPGFKLGLYWVDAASPWDIVSYVSSTNFYFLTCTIKMRVIHPPS